MTEEEANEKICPMTMNTDKWEHCSSRRCMAWRWTQQPDACKGTGATPRGYCGLAGVPR